jgi:type II secretory pathway pseudopilin PulG
VTARDRTVLIVVCLVAAIVGPWLLVIQPKRDQAGKLQTQVNAEQTQLDSARALVASATAARAAFAASYTTLVRLGEAVPTDDNTPSLIYQLQAAAKAARVDFQALTYNAGAGAGPAPAPAPAASSSASTPPAAGSAAAQAAAAPLPPGATIGPAGFPIEPFTFTFQGNFFHLADFLGRLQRFVVVNNQRVSVSGRLMTLNSINLGPGGSGFPQINATISATTYLLPSAQGLLNGATPAGPAAAPTTQTVSSTPPASPVPPAVVTPSAP